MRQIAIAIPAGRYKVRVNAAKHNTHIGRVVVKPGVVTSSEITLENSLVSFEWEVVPITIRDRYEILLEATYDTSVPVPVIVVEPAVVNIPTMCAGDTYSGQFKITNRGLIRADGFQFTPPAADQYFKYEVLDPIPTSLEPDQVIFVSYKLRCLQGLPGVCDNPKVAMSSRNASSSCVQQLP